MRPEHAPQGDPCKRCKLPAAAHRRRKRKRAAYFRKYNGENGHRASANEKLRPIIALDGEGYTLADGSHRYTYLAACDEDGLVSELSAPKGVKAGAVLAWLGRLPARALLVGFSLGYDRTKWLETWPDGALWRLCRPEERLGEAGPLPVEWEGARVNLVSTRMSLKTSEGARRTVWDIFKFFQCSFVKALERWDIGTPKERAHIAREKKRRGSFKAIGERERTYCQLECMLCARLVRALLTAHEDVGLKLPSYYGPGSSAKVWLKETGADKQRARVPAEMREAVRCAFFGGRFECSRVGPMTADRLYAYDLASAYPAAFAELPCMRHGKWRYVEGETNAELAALALVRFHVSAHKNACPAWGPLPHRLPDGNILFPTMSAGGWAWGEEFRAACELHPGVHAEGAWLFEQGCNCPPPYRDKIHELYEERLLWGKAQKGLVLRLALNAGYGASAQRVGKGRFRCLVRAGLITSMTRAKLLRAVMTAKDPWSILELATDSVLSTEPLGIEGKGLGLWEQKPWPGGVFLLRPGLRFPLDPEADDKLTAARGVGPRILHANRARVLRAWDRTPMGSVTVKTPSFFHGMKLSVRRTLAEDVSDDERGYVFTRDALYGRWTDETRTINYSPKPKRAAVEPDYRLTPWELPLHEDARSVPYDAGPQSAIADELDAMRDLADDQGDGGGLSLL